MTANWLYNSQTIRSQVPKPLSINMDLTLTFRSNPDPWIYNGNVLYRYTICIMYMHLCIRGWRLFIAYIFIFYAAGLEQNDKYIERSSDAYMRTFQHTNIASDNGLSPSRFRAIIWTNDGMVLIEPLWKKISEIVIEICTLSFKENTFENLVWKMATILNRPQYVKVIIFHSCCKQWKCCGMAYRI